jgi:pimeloyl-ACP methyl ester carboxylesterase
MLGGFLTAARLTILDVAGHFRPLERPLEFAAAVIAAVGASRYL